jgi:hypothetical protein
VLRSIIGGAACDLLFGAARLSFRATKDIDMVLCVEVVDAAFGEKPTDENYPFMIELFSRKPGTLQLPEDAEIIPIAVDDDLLSLSAILLDDDNYQALQSRKRMVDGVPVLDEAILIPFKARAFLDLIDRAADGEKIDDKNIKKHRNDVFRLLRLLPGDAKIEMPEQIRSDLRRFLDVIGKDQTLDPKSFDVQMSRAEGMELLRSAYGLSA